MPPASSQMIFNQRKVRTGIDPGGHELGKQMPWQAVGRMADEDLRAIYEYLTHMPKS